MGGRNGRGIAAADAKLTPGPTRRATLLVWAGSLVTLAGALHLVFWYWPGAVPLDVTSGVWTALAKDVSAGVLYRPLFGPLGYGGTRYMPLFFLLHGGLIRLGVDPVAAGLSLTALSAVLFDVVLFLVLRQLGVRAALALPLSVLGHATVSVQLLTLGTKCDLLAAALNLATLAAALRPEGHVIIATFALDGPTRCSGLDVVRYDATQLGAELGPGFRLRRAVPEEHRTPAGRVQHFQYCWFSAAT